MTIDAVLPRFLAEQRGRLSPRTFRRYEEVVELLRHCLETFCAHPAIAAVAVVFQPEHKPLYDTATAGLTLMPPIPGGASRQGSVLNGLEGVAAAAPDRVLIHDAARPFVDAGTIDRTLAALETSAGAIAAVPVTDTIKRAHVHAGEPLVADGPL